jgi:hypothetical protein
MGPSISSRSWRSSGRRWLCACIKLTGKAWEFGDGWCVTKKLDNYMYVPEAEIYFAVRGTTLFGNELATEYGGICDGCELYSGSLGERLLTEVLESKG